MKEDKTENPEEKEPLKHEFIIDGEKYTYNIDYISAERMFMGITLFKIHQKMEMNIPALVDEMRRLVDKKAESYAYSCMLVKIQRDDNGNIIKFEDDFDSAKFDFFNPLSKLRSRKEIIKLVECKNDFFMHTGLQQIELIAQFPDIMKQLEKYGDPKKLSKLMTDAIQQVIASGNSSEKSEKTVKSIPLKRSKKS